VKCLVGSATYVVYRGREYVKRWGGADLQTGTETLIIPVPGDASPANFPDALEWGENDGDRWVRLPKLALSREWKVNVYGVWRGVEFYLTILKDWRGPVLHGSTMDKAAEELGVPGSQYDGWAAVLPADEVRLAYRDVFEYPIDIPRGDPRLRGRRPTRIPYDQESEE
jgi:hypothetical protein